MELERYKALALQVTCYSVNRLNTRAEVEAHVSKNIEQLHHQIRASKKFLGSDLRLVVLPEYFMTSFPLQESIEEWRDKACFKYNHKVFDQLKKICIDEKIYLSGNFYEVDDHFSNFYFQSSFIIDDHGEVILNYRRLNSMYAPTPHDVMEEYIATYGYESLFPVADTPLGRLACIASEEILYPEVARCLMMRGAEVFLHSSSEIYSPNFTPKSVAKQARSIENMCYTISANSARIEDYPIPAASTDGGSVIIHYEGHELSKAAPGETIVANANIDIFALRALRSKVSMGNYVARQRFELYAPSYRDYSHYPAETIKGKDSFSKKVFFETQMKTIQRLKEKGTI